MIGIRYELRLREQESQGNLSKDTETGKGMYSKERERNCTGSVPTVM